MEVLTLRRYSARREEANVVRYAERNERVGQGVGSGWEGSVDRAVNVIPHIIEGVGVVRRG